MIAVPAGGRPARAGMRGLSQTAGGVMLGDIIVGVDKKKVATYDDLYQSLDAHRPGDKVEVVVQRGEQKVVLTMEAVVL
ncbi:MAG: PDZ domain-containing protein [Polyangiaceae bacterium]